MDGDDVAVGAAEAQRSPEGTVDGVSHDGDVGVKQGFVQCLGVFNVEPQCGAHTGSGRCCLQVYSREWVAHCEGDRVGGEDDCVLRAVRRANESEVLLVEGCGSFSVPNLQRDESDASGVMSRSLMSAC